MEFCTEFALNLHSRKSKKPLRRGLIRIGGLAGFEPASMSLFYWPVGKSVQYLCILISARLRPYASKLVGFFFFNGAFHHCLKVILSLQHSYSTRHNSYTKYNPKNTAKNFQSMFKLPICSDSHITIILQM